MLETTEQGGLMEIRNLMEDVVLAVVGELFELEDHDHRLGFCTCGQCRLDVACYVLNRMKPEYIVSGRGVAYSERDFQVKVQRRADIITLAKEGWGHVDHSPRPNIDHGSQKVRELPEGPVFNLPTVMGRAFNGLNFEPLAAGTVSLLVDGSLSPMIDANWQNPFVLAKATAGTFILWPRPLPVPDAGTSRHFAFEIKVEVPGFEPISHFFELDLASDRAVKDEFSLQHVHKVPDLYLFPK
jgi:competence protein ComFB